MTTTSQFKELIIAHAKHVANVGKHCTTEETTKQALILPLLGILGFNPYDPTKVIAEYAADVPGVKSGERVDYALFCQDFPVMLIEAKAYKENLNNHAPQLARYFNATPEVEFSIITNGREWRFFTDLKNKNVMDDKPFLRIDFENLDLKKVERLAQFCHDNFQAETLRTLAEESLYLSAFTKTVTQSLKETPIDFVRYVASNSNIGRQLNQKFLETITPIVKQAVENTMADLAVSGLSFSSVAEEHSDVEEPNASSQDDEPKDLVDPNNSKIITTIKEQEIFNMLMFLLEDNEEITWKDTESYFSVLYQEKVNRWLFRYYDKSTPYIIVPIEFSEIHLKELARAKLEYNGNKIFIDKPEHLLRIAGIIFDCLAYCQDDENFRMKK